MPPHFDPVLVNDPFDDAGLYVDLVFRKRAIRFDLGDHANVSTRKLLRVSDIFVTHRHMDHFAGFDSLLRLLIGREKTLSIFGPPGMIDAIEHKLKAYTWNLVEGYDGNLVIRAVDVDAAGRTSAALFAGRSRFCSKPQSMAASVNCISKQSELFDGIIDVLGGFSRRYAKALQMLIIKHKLTRPIRKMD